MDLQAVALHRVLLVQGDCSFSDTAILARIRVPPLVPRDFRAVEVLQDDDGITFFGSGFAFSGGRGSISPFLGQKLPKTSGPLTGYQTTNKRESEQYQANGQNSVRMLFHVNLSPWLTTSLFRLALLGQRTLLK